MPNYDVVIAGYGPTGAVAANLLGAKGHRVLVVEPNLEVYQIPRAVHFDGEVMRIFQALGLAEEIEQRVSQGKKLRFINGRDWQLFEQDLSVVPRQHGWYNNLFFDQPELEKCLRLGATRYDNVELRLGWAVSALDTGTEEQCSVELQVTRVVGEESEVESVVARYVLACDGASSPIRKMLDVPQEDLCCDEPWLVCDLKLGQNIDFERTALQICDPKRPASLIPCERDHIRWEFMLNANDSIQGMENEVNVRAMMAPHMHRLSADLTEADGELIRAKVYTFHALLAQSFQQGRVFLLGDAAHQTPPFLGQGMCAGLRDAYNLSWKLDGVLQGEYASSVLKSYTTERRPHVREVVATAVGHGSVIQTRNSLKAFVRDAYLILGRIIPPLVGFLKFGEGWKLGAGLFDGDGLPNARSPIGEPIPQSRLRQAGESTALIWSDDLLGDGFSLIGFGIDPIEIFADESKPDWLNTVCFGSAENAYEMGGELASWVVKYDVGLALVRPDRQVYGVCKSGQLMHTEMLSLLDRLIIQLDRDSAVQD